MAPAVNENDPNDPFSTKGTLGLRVVWSPEPDKVMMDIWFVHGLFGNRDETWTHTNGTFWPKLLADDFPTARVVTFGYDASVVKFSKLWKGVDTSGLEGYGKDLAYAVRNSRQADEAGQPIPALDVPIYFIGHSLGGLVIEQALLESLSTDESLLPLRNAFRVLLPIWSNNTNGEVLDLLDEKSDICKKVQRQFQLEGRQGKLKGLKMFSFYETIPMAAGKLVVTKDSAVLSTSHCAPISATHSDIVKFSGKSDVAYKKVVGQIREWTKNAVHVDEVKEADKKEYPDQLSKWPGEDGQRRNEGPKYTYAYGARIGTISGTTGGTIDLKTNAVGGDFFDMRYARGKVYGKVMYASPANDVDDQFGDSDQWSNCEEEEDEEGEGKEIE